MSGSEALLQESEPLEDQREVGSFVQLGEYVTVTHARVL